jgi:hypothetical protein
METIAGQNEGYGANFLRRLRKKLAKQFLAFLAVARNATKSTPINEAFSKVV